jgi:hypothetical protein
VRDFGVLKGPDLIQLLSTLLGEGLLLQPGQVHILQATHTRLGTKSELVIHEGHLVHGASNDYKFRLGQTLLKKGLLHDKKQLEELNEEVRLGGRSKAQILIDKGWVKPATLTQVVNHLIEVIAYEVLMWKETDFKLHSQAINPDDYLSYLGAALPLKELQSVAAFVQDADKNLAVLTLMRDTLDNPNMILRRTREVEPEDVSEHQYQVYQYVNNRNSLREVILLSELSYFETFTSLFQLLGWDMVARGNLDVPHYAKKTPSASGAPPTRPTPPPSKPAPPSAMAALKSTLMSPMATSGVQGGREFLKRTKGADLLQIMVSLIKSGRRSGKLVIDNQKNIVRSELTLQRGNLVHATSTLYSDRFGDLLVKKGLIEPEDLRDALEEQKVHRDQRLGQILVNKGLISAETIPKLVYHQMECVLYEVLCWADAKFYYQEAPETQQNEFVVYADYEVVEGRLVSKHKHDGRDLLADADKNLPILLLIREKMPHPKAIVQPTGKEPPEPLSDEQQQVLAMVNGSHTINDIIALSDLHYFPTYVSLFQIYGAGLIELLAAEGEHPPMVAPPRIAPLPPLPTPLPELRRPSATLTASVASSPPPSSALEPSPDEELRVLLAAAEQEIQQLRHQMEILQPMKAALGETITMQLARLPLNKHKQFQLMMHAMLDLILT